MKIKLCREKYGLLTQCCTDNINQSISGTQLLPSKISRLIVNQLKCVENAKFKIKILKTTSLYFRLDTSSSATTTLEISDSDNVGEGTGLEVFCSKNKQCFINLNWNIYEPITCKEDKRINYYISSVHLCFQGVCFSIPLAHKNLPLLSS